MECYLQFHIWSVFQEVDCSVPLGCSHRSCTASQVVRFDCNQTKHRSLGQNHCNVVAMFLRRVGRWHHQCSTPTTMKIKAVRVCCHGWWEKAHTIAIEIVTKIIIPRISTVANHRNMYFNTSGCNAGCPPTLARVLPLSFFFHCLCVCVASVVWYVVVIVVVCVV